MAAGWGGERQIGKTKNEIEPKHVARYTFALKYLKSTDCVLDAACGCGYGSNILAQRAKCVLGVDYSQDAIDYANKYWARDNIKFLKYDLSNDIYNDLGKFDLVVSFETVEHLLAPIHQTIIKFSNILKSGGYLIMSHPEDEPPKIPGAYTLRLTFHFHFKLKGKDIVKMMKLIGFNIVDEWYQEGRGQFPFYHVIVGCKK